MPKSVNFETAHHLQPNEPVQLTVVIGAAQLGGSVALMKGKALIAGEIKDFVLGKPKNLIGETLFIKSAVTDVSDKTNVTSVSYVFIQKGIPQTYTLTATVEEEGGGVIYRSQFHFEKLA